MDQMATQMSSNISNLASAYAMWMPRAFANAIHFNMDAEDSELA